MRKCLVIAGLVGVFAAGCGASPAPQQQTVDNRPDDPGTDDSGGDPAAALYEETVTPNEPGASPSLELTIRGDGSWTASVPDGQKQGALDADQLAELRDLIENADVRAVEPEVTCAAVPTAEITIDAKGSTATFVDMCGAVPTESLAALRQRAHQLTGTGS